MFFSKGNEIVDLVSKHSDEIMICYNTYKEAMVRILAGCDEDERKNYATLIGECETKADAIRHSIIRKMLNGGLLIESRKSLMHMIEDVDRVADLSEDIINKIYLENIEIHNVIKAPIIAINDIIDRQLLLLIKAVKSVIYQYDIEEMFILIRDIEDLESEVDAIEQKAIKEIFSLDMTLSEKIHLREVVEVVADMADLIEDVSDLIEIIMLAKRI